MKDIVVDTCVFFGMIKYNDLYTAFGEKALDVVLARDEQKLQARQSRILDLMPEEFHKKYGKLSFEEKLEKYKDYATNAIASAARKIESLELLLQGKVMEKGVEKTINLTPERRAAIERQLEEQRQLKAKIEATYQTYIDERAEYKTAKNSLEAGKILQGSIKGEYSIHIVSTSYDEIKNHIEGQTNSDDERFLTFTHQQVASLTQRCTLITVRDEDVKYYIDNVATSFRTPIAGGRGHAMDQDINSLNRYGDSTIMAEANLSGMIFVTQNVKDFIEDRSIKTPNDRIRTHIEEVSSTLKPLTSDATPITQEELLTGDYHVPTRPSRVVELVPVARPHREFASEVELQVAGPENFKEREVEYAKDNKKPDNFNYNYNYYEQKHIDEPQQEEGEIEMDR